MSKGLEDKIVKAYYEYMVDIAVIYGADRSRAERELMESLEFEMKLANVGFVIFSKHETIKQTTKKKQMNLTYLNLE